MPSVSGQEGGGGLWVVMATYNGARFLKEQLGSLGHQQLRPAGIIVRDDGSTDDTVAIVREYADAAPIPVSVAVNPRRLGVARNFLTLVRDVPARAAYVAFADQDDIWEPWKLERAVAWLRRVPEDRPAFYASRLRLIDAEGRELGLSPDWPRPPAFANALVENIATGCTMVLNRAAVRLLRRAGVPDVAFHDWWAYLLVTGAGGEVLFDSRPGIRYRQHAGNVAGAPTSLLHAAFKRIRRLGQNRRGVGHILSGNLEALHAVETLLRPEHARIVCSLRAVRTAGPRARLALWRRAGLYRQFPSDDRIVRFLFLSGLLRI